MEHVGKLTSARYQMTVPREACSHPPTEKREKRVERTKKKIEKSRQRERAREDSDTIEPEREESEKSEKEKEKSEKSEKITERKERRKMLPLHMCVCTSTMSGDCMSW